LPERLQTYQALEAVQLYAMSAVARLPTFLSAKAAKLLRAQFIDHSFHLSCMLSKGRNNEVSALRGEDDDPHAPVFDASTRLTKPSLSRREGPLKPPIKKK